MDGNISPCPSGYFCVNSNITMCTIGSYCPSGSSIQNNCSAGSFCESPRNQTACGQGEFCETGSIAPSSCPLGFYCVVPSVKKSCDQKGTYCGLNSTLPQLWFLLFLLFFLFYFSFNLTILSFLLTATQDFIVQLVWFNFLVALSRIALLALQ